MLSNKHHGWMLVGPAALGSAATGVLLGQSASADMDPFYANLSTRMPAEPGENSVQVVDSDGDSRWIKTDALDYPQPVVGDSGDSRY
ncbi:hypothetical protein [Sphingomonas sp.]|uniref:hypothetical protein n=1 Tax=Sphingomonas sp. TaxID=28214 RepID=UPI002E376663|nr:hypothetical protein [Sphingomonas sp.]HEX4694900.1 hypothetical protein [Sphingomonas sp.]